jgi:hypothetical protein
LSAKFGWKDDILKRPKHEIFESGFLHKSDLYGRWLGDWRKKWNFASWSVLFEGFRYEYLIKRMISMRLITKKIQDSPPKKSCVRCLRDLHLKFKKDFNKFFCFEVFMVVYIKTIIKRMLCLLNVHWAYA